MHLALGSSSQSTNVRFNLYKIFVVLQKKNAMRSNSVLEHQSIVANIIIAKNRVETD